MTTTAAVRNEVEDGLKRQPGLGSAIDQAVHFLESRVRAANLHDMADVTIRWSSLPPDPTTGRKALSVTLSLTPDDGRLHQTRVIPTRDLFDPVNRDIWMLRIWGDLLSAVSAVNLERIRREIDELEAQESAHARAD
jgi:hypothetical protein